MISEILITKIEMFMGCWSLWFILTTFSTCKTNVDEYDKLESKKEKKEFNRDWVIRCVKTSLVFGTATAFIINWIF